MGRTVKRNLWTGWGSVDIWLPLLGRQVCSLTGAGGAPVRRYWGCWLGSGEFGRSASVSHARSSCARRKICSVDFGCDGAGDCADDEPFCRAADTLAQGASTGEFQGIVSFPAEGLGLALFVGQVGGGCSEACLAGFAVDGEVVEGFQIFGWDGCSAGGRRVW